MRAKYTVGQGSGNQLASSTAAGVVSVGIIKLLSPMCKHPRVNRDYYGKKQCFYSGY